jgi:hypothetical protein
MVQRQVPVQCHMVLILPARRPKFLLECVDFEENKMSTLTDKKQFAFSFIRKNVREGKPRHSGITEIRIIMSAVQNGRKHLFLIRDQTVSAFHRFQNFGENKTSTV